MKRLFSQFIEHRFLFWGSIVFILLFIAVIVYGVVIYQNLLVSKQTGKEEAEVEAVENSALASVDHVTRYHGSSLYFAVEGETKAGKQAVAFVPEGKNEEVQLFVLGELLSQQEVISVWDRQCGNCRLIDYNWALEGGTPLVEVSYVSESNRYVFEYYNLENGKTYERLPLKQSQY